MLHTQNMQLYLAMPAENCSCLICLLLGKSPVFGPGTRDALGHCYIRPRGRPGYLVLPGQWQVQDCSTGEMLWTCKDGRREINDYSFSWGFRRLGKIPVVKSQHLSPEEQNASQRLHDSLWSQCRHMLMPAESYPQGFAVVLKLEISSLGGKCGSCERIHQAFRRAVGQLRTTECCF